MSINIVEAFATKNKCYQAATPLTPRGIMLHSIGVPQPVYAKILISIARMGNPYVSMLLSRETALCIRHCHGLYKRGTVAGVPTERTSVWK